MLLVYCSYSGPRHSASDVRRWMMYSKAKHHAHQSVPLPKSPIGDGIPRSLSLLAAARNEMSLPSMLAWRSALEFPGLCRSLHTLGTPRYRAPGAAGFAARISWDRYYLPTQTPPRSRRRCGSRRMPRCDTDAGRAVSANQVYPALGAGSHKHPLRPESAATPGHLRLAKCVWGIISLSRGEPVT